MNNRHRKKLNNLLDKLLKRLQKNSALRYQLLGDIRLYLEDIDRKNNTLMHQKKFSQEQVERDLAAQRQKDETFTWIYNIQEIIKRENELFEYEQNYFAELKKNQETSLSMLIMSPEGRKLMEQMEEVRREQQHYIQMLFGTVAECKMQLASLHFRINEIDQKLEKGRIELEGLDKIIIEKSERIKRNDERILVLDENIEQLVQEIILLDNRIEEVRQERHQVIENAFAHVGNVSQLDLSLIQSEDNRFMELIRQVDLVREGIVMLAMHHVDIVNELKGVLTQEQQVDPEIIEKEINKIIKGLVKTHYHDSLSEEDSHYFIESLSTHAYYQIKTKRIADEIMQGKTLHQDLNINLEAIIAVVQDRESKQVEKTERVEEREHLVVEQVVLKEEVAVAIVRKEEIVEEQIVLKQDKVELQEECVEVEQVQSSCKQIIQQVDGHLEIFVAIDQVKAEQKEVVVEKKEEKLEKDQEKAEQDQEKTEQDKIRAERIERMKQTRKERTSNSIQNTTKIMLTATNQMFFHGANNAAENKKERVLESKEKKSIDRSIPSKDNQEVSNDSSFAENRNTRSGPSGSE